jgi:hypothetical protein
VLYDAIFECFFFQGQNFDLRGKREYEVGENYVKSSFAICTFHRIFGISDKGW